MVDFFLKLLKPFIKWWGSMHMPFTRKRITGEHYYKWRNDINIGTVLLSTTDGEFSNIINPGQIKHAAIYLGKIDTTDVRYVVESLGNGVAIKDLVTFMTTKDIIVGCYPKFIRSDKSLFENEVKIAYKKYIGKDYDYSFDINNKSYYCYELCVKIFKDIYSDLRFKTNNTLKNKPIYDSNTFLDEKYFNLVFDSRN